MPKPADNSRRRVVRYDPRCRCPRCGAGEPGVLRTMAAVGSSRIRYHRCNCGAQFPSRERLMDE